MVFLQAKKNEIYLMIWANGLIMCLFKFCTSYINTVLFSPTHTHTLRSSGHRNVFGFSAFCRSVFLSCIMPSTSVEKCDACFWSLGLGFDSQHDHILGLAFAFPTWITMDLAQPWSLLKQNNWKSKVGHTRPSVSTWGSRPSFPSAWAERRVLVSKECAEGCRL